MNGLYRLLTESVWESRQKVSCKATRSSNHVGDCLHGHSAPFHSTSSRVFLLTIIPPTGSPKALRKLTRCSVTRYGMLVYRISLCRSPAFFTFGCISSIRSALIFEIVCVNVLWNPWSHSTSIGTNTVKAGNDLCRRPFEKTDLLSGDNSKTSKKAPPRPRRTMIPAFWALACRRMTCTLHRVSLARERKKGEKYRCLPTLPRPCQTVLQ